MATLAFRSFSRPEMLRSIDQTRLLAYLKPYSEFLSARGIILPVPTDSESSSQLAGRIDYDALTCVFVSPDDPLPSAPVPLIDSACVIDEMATPEGMDALIKAAEECGIDLGDEKDQSPIDVAVQAWLADPEFVQSKHAEQYLDHPRSFEYFPRAAKASASPIKSTPAVLKAIENELDDWFEKHRRGRGSRVFVFPRGSTTWFLIRHGQPLRREGSLDNGKPSSVVYRPERFDVLVYDQTLDELRMNAQSKGEKALYREVLGKRLFGDMIYFGTAAKYTLDPIRVDKRGCLACDDIPGIEWIKLSEVQFLWGGAEREIEIRKATDVFAAYEAKNREMPSIPKIIKARFEVKFKDSKKTRKVTVSAHNTQCLRDADTVLIEQWLEARGFTASGDSGNQGVREAMSEVLVDAGKVAGVADKLRGLGISTGPGIFRDIAPAAKDRQIGGGVAVTGKTSQ